MKNVKKALAILLCFVMLFSSIPLSAYSLEFSGKSNSNDFGMVDEPLAVKEIPEKRDIYSKTYETSVGTNVLISSTSPLHYEKDGELIEIDNTLVESEKDASILTNKSNDFSVELPKAFSKDSDISLEFEGNEISFKLLDTENSRSKNAKIEKAEDFSTDNKKAEELAFVESNINKLSSTVKYENILEKSDVEFTVNSNGFKENIILSSVPSNSYEIRYELSTNGMNASLSDDNSITVSNASGEPIFVVESPYMYDSIGNESENIITQLNKTENGYELVYIPDGEWLANKETVYPVTIDPTITIKKSGSNVPIEDTYISSTLTSNKSTLSTVAVQNSSSKSWGVYNIKSLPQLPANSVIKNSTFNVFTTTNISNPSNIILTALPENATVSSTYVSTVVWSTRINPTDNVVDATRSPSTPGQMNFDITELATKWYQNLDMNRIMVLQGRDGTTKTTIASCENASTSKYPYMTVEYATLEKEYKVTELVQDHGLAGTTYIDDYTGALSYKRTDFRTNSSIGEITFYYGENVNTPQNNMFGLNASMNYFKTISHNVQSGSSSYTIKDAEGKEEVIINGGLYDITETDDEIIVNYDDGIEGYSDKYSKLIFGNNGQIPLIEHSTINHSNDGASEYHTISLLYNEDGYLYEIGNELFRCMFEYTDDGIYSITAETPSAPIMRSYELKTELQEQLYNMDESDPNYENVYAQYEEASAQYEALLDDYNEAIDVSSGNHVETNIVYYSIENNTVKISYECDVSTYSQPECSFTFDNSFRITSITDENNLTYEYSYNDNNQVIKITEKTIDSNENIVVGDSTSFDFGLGYTTVSDGSKSMTKYYDDNGNILSETNEKGISVFYQYDSNNHLIGKSKERYSSGSVLAFCGFEDVNDVMFTAANGTALLNSTFKHSGSSSAKLVSNNGTNAAFTKSFNNLNDNTTYTISMWVKSDSAMNCGLRLSNGDTDGIRTLKPFTSSTDWQRVYCTIDTENSTSINAEIVVDSTASTIIVYADDIALQQSCYLLSDNLLVNGDFSDGLTGWTCSNANYATTETVSSYILTSDTTRLKMLGKINDNNIVSQTVSISDTSGAKYIFGGWINTAGAVPTKASANRDLNISIYAVSNNAETLIDTIDYSAYYSDWQYFEHEIALPTDFGSNNTYSALKLVVNYNNQYGNIYVDGLFLTKDSLYPIEYIYDANFNLIGINNDGNVSYFEEEETIVPATVLIEYDEYGNMIQKDVYTEVEENPTPTEVSRHIINQFEYLNRGTMLTKKISQFGNWADLKYDRFGNLSYFNDENGCIARFEYDNFQNLAAIIKEFDNKNFTDDYEKIHLRVDGGNETEIPTEKTEMTICYSYVGNRLSTIETKYITKMPRPLQEPEVGYVTDPESGAVIYDISNELTINKYSFDYDIWGNLTSVCVDNNGTPVPFAQYSYDNTNYRQLTSIQYNNGQLINYSYDNEGNVIHTYDTYSDTGDTLSYNYYYFDNGECYGKKDLKTNITESIQNNIKTALEPNGRVIYTSQEPTSNSIVKRIGENYVTKTVNGDSQTITVNGLSSTLTRTYDDFGRLYTESYHVDNNHNDYGKVYYYYAHGENLTEEFSEQNLSDGYQNTSNYVRGIQYYAMTPSEEYIEGSHFSYLYWFNGNTATYTPYDTRVFGYNSAGMLLESSVILGGESRYYTYNSQGNVSELSTVTQTGSDIFHLTTTGRKHIYCSYDETNSGTVLKNCLTSIQVNNVNLSTEEETLINNYLFHYDQLGNLTSLNDGTNTTTYTWGRGTMLKNCIVSNNSTHQVSNSVQFKYDDNNMLIQKTVDLGNNNSMIINYIWEDDCLVGTEIDNSEANDGSAGKYNTVILYDPDGNAYGFIVSQTENAQGNPVNNSELFYYVKNNANIITNIVDINGDEVLECSYGDFGEPNIDDSTSNDILTLINPLLLKDSIYDNEMGMYFIDSRFYNPSFGRYISADMSFGQNDKSFLSTNLYVYNKNNPIG
jgi:RHS repeat-associated protein